MGAARGERLYALVEEYAAFGDHRTGTSVDRATREWFAAQLEDRGARVETTDYEFARYVADAEVATDGRAIRNVPLFYSGIGHAKTNGPFVSDLDVTGAGASSSDAADDLLATARARGYAVAVLGTGGPSGRLVAVNRPVGDPPGPVAVLVAGADLAACDRGGIGVTIDARILTGTSATVVGRLGPRDDRAPALVVATPLTGWFGCAGERGTGIALALELLAAMPLDVPVVVVGTTGHELGFLGLHDHLARSAVATRLVVHLGASLAAGDGRELGPLRVALVDGIATPLVEALRDALEPAAMPVVGWDASMPDDAGEGAVWRRQGASVLSLLGWFERFHTPDDVPGAVTSPRLLDTVAGAVLAAVRVLG